MRRILAGVACLALTAACGGGGGGEPSKSDAAATGGTSVDAHATGGAGGGPTGDVGTGGHLPAPDALPSGGTRPDARVQGDGSSDAHTASDANSPPSDAGAVTDAVSPPPSDRGNEPDRGVGPEIFDVRINEVDCHGNDWVELKNLTDADLDLSGWTVSDTADRVAPQGHSWTLPAGTLLPASGFAVVLQEDVDTHVVGFPFGISCSGDDHVHLLRPDNSTADFVDVGAREFNDTWGRIPDGTGAWVHTLSTKGRENEEAIDAGPILYDAVAGGVPTVELFIAPDDVQHLTADPRTTVPADIQITLPETPGDPLCSAGNGPILGPYHVGVHLKGRIGSFRPISGKPGFKIDVNQYEPTQRILGLKELTLNNMVQDRATMSQFAAYEIFRAMGVCAPRVGFARVLVNGDLYGLYADIENYDDNVFGRCFDSTGHVYEGRYGEDLRQDLIDRLDVKEGDPVVRDDMHAIVDALDTPPDGDIFASDASQALFDWDAITREMAVEQYIGHWDGYAPTRNNWVMHVTSHGKLSLQPWGTDQCFGRTNDVYEGQGRLFQTCLANQGCRNLYESQFGNILAVMDGMDLGTLIRDAYAVTQPCVAEDPRSPYREAGVTNSINDLINFLTRRRQDLGAQFECILGANADPDGDGYRCETDCAPDDPTINPGAQDVCRDGIDQNCNGAVDDDPSCPDCETVERDGHRYLICTTARNWQDAGAHCAFFGTTLAAVDNPVEAQWLYEQAHAVSNQDFWIGLNDRDFEGSFTFVGQGGSGQNLPWADGQPNNAGEEDCVLMQGADGRFDDFNCLRQKAVLCEEPCAFTGDRDHDGMNHCGADCNDADNTVFPGAPEICGDGIDQNCDGQVDEGPNCDCFQFFHGPHGYKICGGQRSYADARAACQAQGADLAVFETPGEANWVHDQVAGHSNADLWIGLEDRFQIDEWYWVDGNPPASPAWSPGQPDGGGALDCAVQRADDGLWDDQACDLTFGAICEDTCARRVDTDGDGYPACGTDCDDGDPNVHPGAVEICGDRIDQNCDGRVDEGCP